MPRCRVHAPFIIYPARTVEKNVKAGRLHPVVALPLAQAKSISLEVDYGQNYATEDRFVWLDPALLRKLPTDTSAQPTTQP